MLISVNSITHIVAQINKYSRNSEICIQYRLLSNISMDDKDELDNESISSKLFQLEIH